MVKNTGNKLDDYLGQNWRSFIALGLWINRKKFKDLTQQINV